MRIPYNTSLIPPAPFLTVRVSNLADTVQSADIPALIDTGADATVIPARLVDQVNLARSGDMRVQAYDGTPAVVDFYDIILRLADLRVVGLAVITFQEDYALLGRDVANLLRLLLDGPALSLEVLPSQPSI